MKIQTRIQLIHIGLLVTLSSCLLLSYYLAKKSYQKSIYQFIDSIIATHTKSLIYPLELAQSNFNENTENYKSIHRYALETYKNNREMPLEELKADLLNKFQLQGTEIQLYVTSKDYIIRKSSNPLVEDDTLDLSFYPSAVKEINEAFRLDGHVNLATNITRAIHLNYIKYSYVKLDNDNVLEISFSNKTPVNEIVHKIATYSLVKQNVFSVFENNNEKGDYFYSKMSNKPLVTNEEVEAYITQEKHYIALDQESTDPIVQAFKSKEPIIEVLDNHYIVYANIFQRGEIQTEYTDIIARFEVDIIATNIYLERLRAILIGVFILLLIIWLVIYLVLKKYLVKPLHIVNEHVNNGVNINVKHFEKNSEIGSIATKYNTLLNNLTIEIQHNEDLLSTDHLTKALNRKAFDKNMAEYLKKYHQIGEKLCVLMLDLDNFKVINDTLGHAKGDEVLIELASIAQQTIDKNDDCYRLGGEEFAIIFQNSKISDAVEMGNLINKHLNEAFSDLKGICVSFSGGLSMMKENDDVESIYKRCDSLMYKAKTTGKNHIEVDFFHVQ